VPSTTYNAGWNQGQYYGYNYNTYTPSYTYPIYTPSYNYSSYVAPVAYANTYPQVSLTQIPYTGFDFGSFGDSIYFAALAAFGVAAAYLLAYYAGAGSFLRKVALKIDGIRGYNNLV
jgi:hypothetical protein